VPASGAPKIRRNNVADDEGVVLSVRGEAQRTVEPDSVVLAGAIQAWRDSKVDAVSAVGATLRSLTADLSQLGGVALTIDAVRRTLTWSAHSATTHAERDHDRETGRGFLTGRIGATVQVGIIVRDFGLLDALGATFARHDDFDVSQVTWDVDDDNPTWPVVRSDAIQAALRKGRDYAFALGVSLTRVQHVADTGLLGGTGDGPQVRRRSRAAMISTSGGGREVDTPSLDPVPQELTAVIEARFETTPAEIRSDRS
jgi:uncharacterized protein YggE